MLGKNRVNVQNNDHICVLKLCLFFLWHYLCENKTFRLLGLNSKVVMYSVHTEAVANHML